MIGEVAPRHLSFMGSITAPGRLIRDTAPDAVARLVEHHRRGAAGSGVTHVQPDRESGHRGNRTSRNGSVCLVLLREIAEKVRPPRALEVPFRHGYPLGRPDDPEGQRKVLEAALRAPPPPGPGAEFWPRVPAPTTIPR